MRRSSRPESPDTTGVSKLLANLPDPGPMPDDLGERILARLTSEDPAGATVTSLPWWRTRRNQVGLATAALAIAGGGVAAMGGPARVAASFGMNLPVGVSSTHASASARTSPTGPAAASSVTPGSLAAAGITSTHFSASGRDWSAGAAQALDLQAFARKQAPLPTLSANAQSIGPLASELGATDCFVKATGTNPTGRLIVDVGTVAGHPGALIAAGSPETGFTIALVNKPCSAIDVITQEAPSR